MADTTISISIPEAQWSTVQAAFATDDGNGNAVTIDAAYTVDHWENRCLPGLVTSSSQAADSVRKLRKIAKETNALVVTGHDPDDWINFNKGPTFYYE